MNHGIKPKQAGIILTLLVGIVCVGLLAHRVNSQLPNGNEIASTSKENENTGNQEANAEDKGKDKEGKGNETNDSFYELKSRKEQEDQKAVKNLKAITADANTSKEQKQKATDELTRKTTSMDSESRIELSIKSKGFAEAVCFIEGDTGRVVINRKEKLTEKETLEIQDIAKTVAQIYDIQIELAK
ncbi:MAG: SpoIIIAH-like family protein [Sarcina sp.]